MKLLSVLLIAAGFWGGGVFASLPEMAPTDPGNTMTNCGKVTAGSVESARDMQQEGSPYPRCNRLAESALGCIDDLLADRNGKECRACMGLDDGSYRTYDGCRKTKSRTCRKLRKCRACRVCRGPLEETADCFLTEAESCYGMNCGFR